MKNNSRRRLKKFLIWITVIFALPVIALIGLYLFLPLLIESSAPPLAKFYGIANFAMKVETLNWNEVDIRKIRVGTAEHSGISVEKVRFLRSSSGDQPNKIIISGAVIEFNSLKKRFFIPGVKLPISNPKMKPEKTLPTTSLLKLPDIVNSFTAPSLDVRIEKSTLVLRCVQERDSILLKLPCNMHLTIDKDGNFNFNLNAETEDLKKNNSLLPELTCQNVNISLISKGVLHKKKACKNISAKLAILFTDLKFRDKKSSAVIPELKVSCDIKQVENTLHGKAVAEFANANIESGDFRLDNIFAYFPLEFMYGETISFNRLTRETGFLKVGKISFNKRKMGNFEIKYKQRKSTLILIGKHQGIIPNHKTPLLGNIKLPVNEKDFSASLKCFVDCKNHELDLGKYVPKMSEMVFNGKAELKSNLNFKKGKLAASAKFEIHNANIEDKKKEFLIKNLNVGFHIPNLMEIRSAPSQKLSFDSLKCGEIEFGRGDLQFQLESKKSFFLEKSEIKWCGGHVDFGAIRINFDKPENVDFTFYCDRLNVANLLNQLKVAKATGGGKVAGRIPIKYNDGKLVIQNGFLYSTPGEGGKIQLAEFEGSELANSNLQISIAKEALKEYNYKWIKITFNTTKESLMMRLELDGAPDRYLPFAFDEKQGMKYEKNAKANFQGISFDIGFNIPIDDIIYYGNKTSNLFK